MSEHSMARRVAIIGAASAVIISGGFAAYAAIPSADGTISGCYAKSDSLIIGVPYRKGEVRVVTPGEACKSYESPISWSERGPQGVPGSTGPTGAQGPQGEPGAAGEPAISGYEIVPATSTVPAGDTARVVGARVGCPGDKIALNGGFDVIWRGPDGHGPVFGKVSAMGMTPGGTGYHFDLLVEPVAGATDYVAQSWVACADLG